MARLRRNPEHGIPPHLGETSGDSRGLSCETASGAAWHRVLKAALSRPLPGSAHRWPFPLIPCFSRHMSKQRIATQFVPSILPALLFPIAPIWTQTLRSRVTGVFTDESKAVIAGASVTFTNADFDRPAMLGSAHEEEL